MTTIGVQIFYSFAFLGMLYAFYKVGINRTSILIIFVFWEGFFDYLDDIFSMEILNIYKSAIIIYAISLLWKRSFRLVKSKTDLAVNITFLLFSASFWITYSFYGGEISTILSQYLFKYAFLWIAYHYLKDITYNIPKREYVKKVLLIILYVQIAISALKIILMGFRIEGLVGSMSLGGGGAAVVIPIVALIFYWLIRNGRFKKMDWIVIALILAISIASGKRQPIIIYPVILLSLFIFVSKSVRPFTILKYLFIALVVFYFGVRMTPSITPENKAGGSFDISYFSNYIMEYYFGTTNQSGSIFKDNYYSSQRGDGVILYFKPKRLTLSTTDELFFGKGIYEVAVNKYGRFTAGSRRSDYGIQHDGLIGEAAALLYTLGYMGTISLILMVSTIVFSIRNKRLAWIMFLYFLWDFLFYYNQMFFFNSSVLIVLFIVNYANSHEIIKVT